VHIAIANLKYILGNKTELLNNTMQMSQLFRTRLSQMSFKAKGKINIIGLAIGVDVKSKAYAALIHKKCLNEGLLLMPNDNYIVLFPALNIKKSVVQKGLDILEKCI
jgi:4-aminobutyrate aminotransferase-like enzyme